MPIITTNISTDERTYQEEFYSKLYGENDEWKDYVHVDRSTDGYTEGILFEHKTNVTSYGEAKALSQAIIYLTRFNRDGVPVPKYVCLVSQEEQKVFIYDMENYVDYINDIEQYANMQASKGIPHFQNKIGRRMTTISYDLSSVKGMMDLYNFIEKPAEAIKVSINVHNVYGWSGFYYDHAKEYGQKPEKKAFFNELREPKGTLRDYIHPWAGREIDFKYIMDMLNDPATQKLLGSFYTPVQYVRYSQKLVEKAIDRCIEAGKKDYVIFDLCAGTGALECMMSDEILSHVIVSTYELKEWMVLKDRLGTRVRYIIPPIPESGLPKLNDDGFLSGANALTREIIDNSEVRKYLDNENCGVILLMNPPYAETTSVDIRRVTSQNAKADWKKNFIVEEMKKDVKGVASNDMANAFIWMGFKYFLRQPSDSYIVYSPITYWKPQHLINKKFIDGYAFNRLHFHAKSPSCIICALWSNEEDRLTDSFIVHAYDIQNNEAVYQGDLKVKRVYSKFSDKYYDTRTFEDDTHDGIACEYNGEESSRENHKLSIPKTFNDNMLGYMSAQSSNIERTALHDMLLVSGRYDGHGFYLRKDNFCEKLPLFVAGKYSEMNKDWKVSGFIMKSGDKAEQYKSDVKTHRLDNFLCHCLIWVCLSHYPHMRSLYGSDGRFYRNELCFDGDTVAKRKLDEFIKNGCILTEQENELLDKYNALLEMVKVPDENTGQPKENYHSEYTYGLYQIDEEINLKDKITLPTGKIKNQYRYGDMNNLIKEIKTLLKQYYIDNLADTLFEYEFLK